MDRYFFEVKEDFGWLQSLLASWFWNSLKFQMEFSRNKHLGSHLAPERLCWESFTQQKTSFS